MLWKQFNMTSLIITRNFGIIEIKAIGSNEKKYRINCFFFSKPFENVSIIIFDERIQKVGFNP